jgi:fucose permease
MSSLTPDTIRSSAIRARNVVWLSFGVLGLLSNAWVPRIPEIKQALGLTNSQFGIALIGGPAGAAIGAQVVGRLIHAYGSKWISLVCGLEMAIGIAVLANAHSLPTLMLALFLQGVGYGGLDNALNTQAVAIETHLDRKYMSGFHGAWSVGALVAVIVGGSLSRVISPHTNILAVAIVAFIIYLPAIQFLLPGSLDGHAGSGESVSNKVPLFERKTMILWAIGVALMGCLIPEAAASDWGGILLHEHMKIATGLDSTAFGAFGIAMIVGRFSGDHLMMKFGAERVVKIGGYIGGAVLGAAIAVAVPLSSWNSTVALVIVDAGFIVAGLGIGPMVPAFISATGKIPGIAPSVAIARVGIIGIFSYFIGPVVTGNLADLINLPVAMTFPCLALIAAGFLSRTVRPSKSALN